MLNATILTAAPTRTHQVAVSVSVSEGASVLHNGRVVCVASEATFADILVATGLWNRRSHVLDVQSAVLATVSAICRNKKGCPPAVIFSVMKPQSDNFFGAA